MRKSSGLLLASGMIAAVSLTGCAQAASCAPEWSVGGIADVVEVEGAFGGPIEATFPTPLVQSSDSTTALLIEGDGEVVREGQFATVRLSILDGGSGVPIDAGVVTRLVDDAEPRLVRAAECAPVGSRVVAVGPAGELIGSEFLVTSGLPLADDQTLVFVLDVVGAALGRADGADRLPQNGLPTVSLAPDGRPGLTFTNSPAPEDLRVSVLKEGSGATVEAGDVVVLNSTLASWTTRKVIATSWDAGTPVFVPVEEGATDAAGTFFMSPGIVEALVGQRVGSQVLVSVPVELGGGAADPVVAVIDVLGIQGEG